MKKNVINPVTWGDRFHFVQANEYVGAKRMLICSGQVAIDDDGNPLHPGDMRAQAESAWQNLERLLSLAGYELADVAHITYYTTDVDAYIVAHREVGAPRLNAAGCKPSCTLLGISRLGFAELLVEIEALAVRGD